MQLSRVIFFSSSCKKAGNLKNRVQELELQIAMFTIQKNLPIAIAENLMNFIKNTDFHKDTQTKVTCDRTKCTALIQNVIRKYSFGKIVSALQGNPGKKKRLIDISVNCVS